MKISGIEIECVVGDITKQDSFDAIVNAANRFLAPGGGVAGAIHRAAGRQLYELSRPLAPISPGEAVITAAGKLKNKFVVHCLGPIYGRDVPSDKILANCYKNSLRIADEKGVKSIAFPAISAGAFGYPIVEAADVAVKTVCQVARDGSLENIRKVRFVLFSDRDFEVFSKALENTEL